MAKKIQPESPKADKGDEQANETGGKSAERKTAGRLAMRKAGRTASRRAM